MRLFDTERDDLQSIHAALTESTLMAESAETDSAVREILNRVRHEGDVALVDYTHRFDSPSITAETIEVSRAEIDDARDSVKPELLNALDLAASNIQEFHLREKGQLQSWMHFAGGENSGRLLGQVIRPVRRAGVYVPGGHAAYPSTVLMAAVPARVAGVDEVVICTPPNREGQIPPLVAAATYGWADRVFRVGGAQAIGAMAYGTKTVPQVDVVVGPGNRFVNSAKRLVYGTVGIDMLAGPSEVCIIADSGANPRYIAADLLAQTEHGPDNRGVLISDTQTLIDDVIAEIESMMLTLKRHDILYETLENDVFIKTSTIDQAIELANLMAPEHLELQLRDPIAYLPRIRNAGAVLLGDATGAALGDYVAGPSHTLPTAGAARFSSPLSVATFLKRTNYLSYTPAAAIEASVSAELIALGEGFDGHALSATVRRETRKN